MFWLLLRIVFVSILFVCVSSFAHLSFLEGGLSSMICNWKMHSSSFTCQIHFLNQRSATHQIKTSLVWFVIICGWKISRRYSLTDNDTKTQRMLQRMLWRCFEYIFSSASAVSVVASFVNSTTLGKKDVNILQDNPPSLGFKMWLYT